MSAPIRYGKADNTQFEVQHRGDSLSVEIHYPRSTGAAGVEVDLMDVRATDPVRVVYDFERNGWSILQASTFEWDGNDPVCDPDWQEVAFVPSWGRKKPEEEGAA